VLQCCALDPSQVYRPTGASSTPWLASAPRQPPWVRSDPSVATVHRWARLPVQRASHAVVPEVAGFEAEVTHLPDELLMRRGPPGVRPDGGGEVAGAVEELGGVLGVELEVQLDVELDGAVVGDPALDESTGLDVVLVVLPPEEPEAFTWT
jgi:hypothetical protein